MPTIGAQIGLFSGKTTLTLELYASGIILNAGGDALVEVGATGFFQANVAETISTNLSAIVKDDGVIVYEGILYLGARFVDQIVVDATSGTTLTDDLIASWPLCEGVPGTHWDQSPRKYNLHSFGRTETPLGNGVRFIQADAASLFATPLMAPDIFTMNTFTIAFQFRFTSAAGQNGPIVSVHNASAGARGMAVYRTTAGKLAIVLSHDGTAQNALATTADIIQNQWHHVVIRYDGSNMMVSLDGTQVTKAHATGWNKPAGINFEVGAYTNGASKLTSDVDVRNLSLWNRSLTDQERDEWFNVDTPLIYPFESTEIPTVGLGRVLPVVIIHGQSDAVGTPLSSELLAEYTFPEIPLWESFRNVAGQTSHNYDGFVICSPNAQESGAFGPEIGIGDSFRDGIGIIKYALGGSYLDSTGVNNWSASGGLRTHATGHVDSALADLRGGGWRPVIVGVLWVQGEADALDADAAVASRYEANLTDLIGWFESRYGSDVPVLVARLNQTEITSYPLPNGATVRAAQEAVAAAIGNVTLLNTDSFPLKVDNLHFNTNGQLMLGEMTAAWMRGLIAAWNDPFEKTFLSEIGEIVDSSFVSYDPPTRSEATSDKSEILSAMSALAPTIVIPVLANVPQRVQGKRIDVWTNEEVTLNVPVLDEDGNSIDFTGRDFWFGVWDRSKTLQVETTAAGTSMGFEVTIPKLTQASSNMEWALRDSAASNTGIATGLFGVSLKPTAPAPP